MTVTTYGDNPFQPGVTHDTYIPDQLIAGQFPIVTQPIWLNSGALKRGTVLGKVSVQPLEAVATVGNTGNGAFSALTATDGHKVGAYVLTATDATHFSVVDPEGTALPNLTVGVAYAQSGFNATLAAGGTAFVAGDSFTVTVEAGSAGQYIKSVKTAADGSQTPVAILVDDADASAGPVQCGAYLTGEFNSRAVIYDASWSMATLRDALRSSSIFLKASVSAADPS